LLSTLQLTSLIPCVSLPVGSQTMRLGSQWRPHFLSRVPGTLHKYAKPSPVGKRRAITLLYFLLSETNVRTFLRCDENDWSLHMYNKSCISIVSFLTVYRAIPLANLRTQPHEFSRTCLIVAGRAGLQVPIHSTNCNTIWSQHKSTHSEVCGKGAEGITLQR